MPVIHDSHVEVNRVELKNVNVGLWGGYLVMRTDTDVTFKAGFVAGEVLHKVQHVMSHPLEFCNTEGLQSVESMAIPVRKSIVSAVVGPPK